ncbi:hypothetical protein [Mesorhizobium sp. M0965]|uniref:hypothetical protein n=1 Tax=unclassified Mesorhizobium TaxID=325217 RepID=UPI003336FF0F
MFNPRFRVFEKEPSRAAFRKPAGRSRQGEFGSVLSGVGIDWDFRNRKGAACRVGQKERPLLARVDFDRFAVVLLDGGAEVAQLSWS